MYLWQDTKVTWPERATKQRINTSQSTQDEITLHCSGISSTELEDILETQKNNKQEQ